MPRLFAFCLTILSLLPGVSVAEELATPEPASDFTLRDLDGGNVALSDYLGKKVIVINFWATWCSPCLKEMPHLQAMQGELGDKIQVISISVDAAKDEAKVKALVKKLDYTPQVLLDPDTRVVRTYHPRGMPPFSMVIGKDRRVHYKKLGYTDGDEAALKAVVQRLVAAR
jgi:peroxiredoxin